MAERVVLGGWPGFSLPDLSDASEGWSVFPVEETVIDVRHHDTDDFRLAGDGIAVTADDDVWVVALPGNRSIERRGASAPVELSSLLVAHLRGEPLVEVARVRTRRRGVELRDGSGQPIGRVVDDEVSVIDHDRVSARFRELVIEGDPAPVTASIERSLRSAGATDPDPLPRLQRALGSALDGPVSVGAWSSAAELLAHQLIYLRRRWLRADVLLRSDQLGPTRYAGPPARLRALVRAMRPLVDRDWADSLDALIAPIDTLAQTAAAAARRASFIEASVARLGQADDGARFVARARVDAQRALDHLVDELDSRAYLDLVDAVVHATNAAPFLPDSHGAGIVLLPRLAAELFGAWRRSARVLDPTDQERIDRTVARIDRVAAIAATAAPAVPGAERHALRLRAAGRVVSDIAVMHGASCWLRERVERGVSRRQGFVAGVLSATLESDSVDLADAWPEIWRRAERRKARAWLTS